jgi:hypothetical protein
MAELDGDDSVQLFAQPRKKSSKRKHVADGSAAAPKSKHVKKDPESSSSSLQQQQQEQKQDVQAPQPHSKQHDPSEITDACFHDLGVSDWLCAVLDTVGKFTPAVLCKRLSACKWPCELERLPHVALVYLSRVQVSRGRLRCR